MPKGDFSKTKDFVVSLRASVRDGKLAGLLDHNGADIGFPVTATESATGGVNFSGGIGFSKKRRCYPRNLMDPRLTGGYVQTLGTANEVAAASETGSSVVTAVATENGSTARILKGWSALTLDTTKYYELSCTIVVANFGDVSAMSAPWLGLSLAVAEGAQALNMTDVVPVAGQRYSLRFRPAQASNIVRFGIGINSPETVLTGDTLVGTDFSLYEIPSLTSEVIDYSFNASGVCGMEQEIRPSYASCIWAIGDSWSNDPTDWPVLLGLDAGREVRVSAMAGDSMAQMLARMTTASWQGNDFLLRPNRFIPGVAVFLGGINDLVGDTPLVTMISRAQALIDFARARKMVPLFVLQPYASDSNHYTAGRMAIRAAFAKYIKQEGVEYIDLAVDGGYLNADGTASATNMLSESGNWIHPSPAGIAVLAALIETRLRQIDRNMSVLVSPTWP